MELSRETDLIQGAACEIGLQGVVLTTQRLSPPLELLGQQGSCLGGFLYSRRYRRIPGDSLVFSSLRCKEPGHDGIKG